MNKKQYLHVEGLKNITVTIGDSWHEQDRQVSEASFWKLADESNWPSYPHLYCIHSPERKINIYTGEIYGRHLANGQINTANMKILWTDVGFLEMVQQIRKTCPEPSILPEIPNYFRQ